MPTDRDAAIAGGQMTTDERIARRIIRILDLARSDSISESDIGTPELAAADRIKALYSKHKQHMSFTDAADEARVEVIRAELADLIADGERLDWLAEMTAGEYGQKVYINGKQRHGWIELTRQAIDAARR